MAEKYVNVFDADKRSPQMKVWAQTNDKKTHKLLMKRVTNIPANAECANCTAKRPGWAALPHGIHICINCAQIHRRIGRHISQVKAINTGTYLWYQDEYQCMVAMGNEQAERLYLGGAKGKAPPKPDKSDSVDKKEAYIRDLYEHHKYINPNFKLQSSPTRKPSNHKVPRHQPALQRTPVNTSSTYQTPHAPQLVFQATTNSSPPGQGGIHMKKQPASYDDFFATLSNDNRTRSSTTDNDVIYAKSVTPTGTTKNTSSADDVDFFAMFDMKPKLTQEQHKRNQDDDFSDIMSLYRD